MTTSALRRELGGFTWPAFRFDGSGHPRNPQLFEFTGVRPTEAPSGRLVQLPMGKHVCIQERLERGGGL